MLRLLPLFVSLLLLPCPKGRAQTAARGTGGLQEKELGRLEKKRMDEISGLVASRKNPGVLWVHNDDKSGRIFAIDLQGKLLATFVIGDDLLDPEDIAIGPGPKKGVDYLYLGDIGDNEKVRQSIRVYRFPEPLVTGSSKKSKRLAGVEILTLRYPDGSYDAETLMVDPMTKGDLYIATKQKSGARIYRAPSAASKPGSAMTLQYTGKIAIPKASAGEISHDGSLILMRNESSGWLWERRPGRSVAATLGEPATRIPVRGRRQGPNGEAIGFDPGKKGYYTLSEGEREMLVYFPLPAAAR